MSVINVDLTHDTFDNWRVKTNQIASEHGDHSDLSAFGVANITTTIEALNHIDNIVGHLADLNTDSQTSIIAAINELKAHDNAMMDPIIAALVME